MKITENKGFLTLWKAMGRSVALKTPFRLQISNKIDGFMSISYGTALILIVLILQTGCSREREENRPAAARPSISLILSRSGVNPSWTIVLSNTTTHWLYVDFASPERSQLNWTFLEGDHQVDSGSSRQPSIPFDIPAHYSSGPKDIAPGQIFQWPLVGDNYARLTNSVDLKRADRIAWHYFAWDSFSNEWMSASGSLQLN